MSITPINARPRSNRTICAARPHYDVARQGLISHHFLQVDGHLERRSIPFRYVWPSELDLMAQLAGMRLRAQWSGWKREPFTSESTKHVAVWEKPVV